LFAKDYIRKKRLHELFSDQPPDPGTGIIVVIPCFNEPDILFTLESLQRCEPPARGVEVIILINYPEDASGKIRKAAQETFKAITDWYRKQDFKGIRYLPSAPVILPRKWAGAGLARKKGMDEAILRFSYLNKPDGLLVSLDADTTVRENYLFEIENHFTHYPEQVGATLAFEHPLEGLEPKHREGIWLYETYLAYYKEALMFAGYPNALFTIGSAFVVTADAYVKRGGMNRRKAGEDFYFLQNLVQQGEVGEIHTTRVFPSARLSDRVPFGTGPILKKWIEGKEDLTQTYSFQAFADLRSFFRRKEEWYTISHAAFEKKICTLPEAVAAFLRKDNFFIQIDELNKNCASLKVYNQRFFQLFNAFKILKFLHFTHESFYRKADLREQVIRLRQAQ